ncbi:heat- and acid-stable phosphoprotein [Mortierella alpina]|nr:heat- and acid-stable phosphoprotein [Mortierella alpina]
MARGKFKKPQRGGGRTFSRRIEAVHTNSASTTAYRDNKHESSSEEGAENRTTDTSESESDSGSESEQDNEVASNTHSKGVPGVEISNPNHQTPVSTRGSKALDMSIPIGMSRREREAAEKEAAKQRYWKLHQAGKTDEAKADMARLAVIRKQREEAAARREAEAKAKDMEIAAKYDVLRR